MSRGFADAEEVQRIRAERHEGERHVELAEMRKEMACRRFKDKDMELVEDIIRKYIREVCFCKSSSAELDPRRAAGSTDVCHSAGLTGGARRSDGAEAAREQLAGLVRKGPKGARKEEAGRGRERGIALDPLRSLRPLPLGGRGDCRRSHDPPRRCPSGLEAGDSDGAGNKGGRRGHG